MITRLKKNYNLFEIFICLFDNFKQNLFPRAPKVTLELTKLENISQF